MTNAVQLDYVLKSKAELNQSFMPFIQNGGLFIPTNEFFDLGAKIVLDLQLPAQTETLTVEGKVVWITPKNALHYVVPGIGIQLTSPNATMVHDNIKACLE